MRDGVERCNEGEGNDSITFSIGYASTLSSARSVDSSLRSFRGCRHGGACVPVFVVSQLGSNLLSQVANVLDSENDQGCAIEY